MRFSTLFDHSACRATAILATLLACAVLAACHGGSSASAQKQRQYTAMQWEQLIPPEALEEHRLAAAFAMRNIDHTSEQRAAQFGSFKTIAALDGRAVSLRGYVVPLESDDDGRVTEFFFVPTLGACIHVPPPPPDQMIYVHPSEPIGADEVRSGHLLQGILKTSVHDTDMASAAYSMQDAHLMAKADSE